MGFRIFVFQYLGKNWLDYQTSELAGLGGFEVKEVRVLRVLVPMSLSMFLKKNSRPRIGRSG